MITSLVSSSATHNLYLDSLLGTEEDYYSKLEISLQKTIENLQEFAQSSDFIPKMKKIFGVHVNVDKLQYNWSKGNISLPSIEILNSDTLVNARGAYGSSTNTIYLSDHFLDIASIDEITGVILEEFGHFVDAQINSIDTQGDEGHLFSTITMGENLSKETLQALKAEDDSAIITIDGKAIAIEQSAFLNPANFTLNGSAQFTIGVDGVSSVLRLTNDYWQTSSAFLTNTVALSNNASFSTYFQFQITDSQQFGDDDGPGADGLVFTVQTIANNVGGAGWGIGYAGIDRSLGIEFDTYNNGEISGNHIGVDLNGNLNSVIAQPVVNRLNNGNIWNAWVDYNGVSDALEVRISETNQRPTTAFLSYTVDLPTILGNTNAFIGFTSGTGSGTGDHDIIDWQFNGSYNPIGEVTVTLAVSPTSVLEDGTTNLVYTFTRTGAITNALTVNYSIAGTANSTDYTGATPGTGKTITFGAGSSTATLVIDPTADSTVEPNETVALTLANGTGYTVGTTTAVTGTILNDDTRVTLAVSPASVLENGTNNLVYTFTRTGVITNGLTVNYSIGGTANSSDYTGATPGMGKTIAFAAGSSTATLTIDPTPDTIIEPNETVALTLANGTGYTVGTTTAVTGTITNDDLPRITLAVNPASVNENGTTKLVYTFTRTGPTTNALTVNYSIGGTANSNDYTGATPGTGKTIAFAAGSSTATLVIDPTADSTVEPNETIALTLASGTGYTVGTTTSVTGTILNDDSVLSIDNVIVIEGQQNQANLTVSVNNSSTSAITVNYATSPINATANTDYTTRTGTLTIVPNTTSTTVSIPILNDNLNEEDESFILTLSNPVNAVLNPDSSIGEVTITDTLPTRITRTLLSGVENLSLQGVSTINGTGNTGNNIITGNSANNIISGLNGNDTLIGGVGNDTLIGGSGNDSLTGGTGNDFFRFNYASEKVDRITDFNVINDTIQVSASGFGGGLAVGALLPTQFVIGASATTSAHRFIYNSSSGALFFDADGNGTTAVGAVQIATLNTNLAMTYADIVVI